MYHKYIKRVEDIAVSLVLIVFFLPVSIMVAILIKLESPKGPIFADTPPRVGKNGKLFYTFKFRSMIPNAVQYLKDHPELMEEYKKSSFKLHNDPRVLKVGRIIRKYSLDEVPQFVNVLKGEMSVVGPRPYYADELEDQQKKYPHTKELVKRALSVRPGITGIWQVSGRSNVNFDKRIEMDATYAKNINGKLTSSLWYDLKILLKTPYVMISGRGAV